MIGGGQIHQFIGQSSGRADRNGRCPSLVLACFGKYTQGKGAALTLSGSPETVWCRGNAVVLLGATGVLSPLLEQKGKAQLEALLKAVQDHSE